MICTPKPRFVNMTKRSKTIHVLQCDWENICGVLFIWPNVPLRFNIFTIDCRYDSRNSVLEWSVVLIDNSNRRLAYVETCFCSETCDLKYLFLILIRKWKNCSGSLEFVVPAADPDVFFPISARFTASRTFSDLKVSTCFNIVVSGDDPDFIFLTVLICLHPILLMSLLWYSCSFSKRCCSGWTQ